MLLSCSLQRLRPHTLGHRAAGNRHSVRSVATMAAPQLAGDVFFLDSFAIRQWDDPNYAGTRIAGDKAEFLRKVHEAHKSGSPLVDG